MRTKKYFCVLIVFLLASAIRVFGLDASKIQGPGHQLINTYSRVMADTIYYIYHYEMGAIKNTTGKETITRSADGLTDTVFIQSGLLGYTISRYNEKNQLLYTHAYYPNYPETEYTKNCYVYDDNGYFIQERIYKVSPLKDPAEILDTVINYNMETDITYTDKGYIQDFGSFKIEYELDSFNHVTYMKYPENEDEYAEYEGVKYRVGDNYYTYTDSSYIKFGRERVGKNMLGWPDMWVRAEHVYNEDGSIKYKKTTTSKDGVTWNIWEYVEFVYKYSSGNPYSNEPLPATTTQVYTVPGAIRIHTEKASKVGIYTFGGRLEKSLNIPPGDSTMGGLPPGIYIVNVGNDSFKVIVR